jgi:regulatory protein
LKLAAEQRSARLHAREAAHDAGDAPPRASTRVRSVDPLDAKGLRARVTLEDGSVLEVATEVLERSGFGAGDPVDDADRARLVHEDTRWQLREAALSLLATRPRSRQELARRLRGKGFARALVDDCLSGLAARQLVDDGAFAHAFLRDRLRLRPKGGRRLTQELREKGVDPAAAEQAVAEVFAEQGVSEEALALDAARAWLRRQNVDVQTALTGPARSPERIRALRRLQGFLARRGFTGELVRQASSAVVEGAREDTSN